MMYCYRKVSHYNYTIHKHILYAIVFAVKYFYNYNLWSHCPSVRVLVFVQHFKFSCLLLNLGIMPPPRPKGIGFTTGVTPARPSSNTPMSERQQMALLIQMTATSSTGKPKHTNLLSVYMYAATVYVCLCLYVCNCV